MKKFIAGAASAALISLAGAAQAETVKVGLIAPFSGPFAVWGAQFKMGVEAFQKVNGMEVNGHKIEVVYRDSGGINPAKTRQHAEELIIREKARFLTGFTMTPNALSVAEIINETKIPAIIMNAATGMITRRSQYYARVSMTIPQYIKPVGDWAAKVAKKKTAYTIVSDYAPGHDAEVYFAKGFEKNGGKILGKDRAPLSTSDFAPYLERAAKSGAEAVYIFVPAGAPSIAAIREFAKRGLKDKGVLLLAGGEVQEIFLPAIGDDVVGAISGLHYTETRDSAENKKFRKALEDLYGKQKGIPDIATVGAWGRHEADLRGREEIRPESDRRSGYQLVQGHEVGKPARPGDDRSERARYRPERLSAQGRKAQRQARQHRLLYRADDQGPVERRKSGQKVTG